MKLTPKQEAFCMAYVETGNATEAYRQTYDCSKMKPASINRCAKEMLDTPKISSRIDELREEARQRHRLTVDDLLAELEQARQAAQMSDKPQAGAMVAATMGKAKLLGLLVDKAELTGKDGQPLGGQPAGVLVVPAPLTESDWARAAAEYAQRQGAAGGGK